MVPEEGLVCVTGGRLGLQVIRLSVPMISLWEEEEEERVDLS